MKGADNPAADSLSRIGSKVIQSPVQRDGSSSTVRHDLLQLHNSHSSLTLKEVSLPMSDTTVVCDMSSGVPRPFVSSKFYRSGIRETGQY